MAEKPDSPQDLKKMDPPPASSVADDALNSDDAIHETCNYIATVMTNFKINASQLSPAARKYITDLQGTLKSLHIDPDTGTIPPIQLHGHGGARPKSRRLTFNNSLRESASSSGGDSPRKTQEGAKAPDRRGKQPFRLDSRKAALPSDRAGSTLHQRSVWRRSKVEIDKPSAFASFEGDVYHPFNQSTYKERFVRGKKFPNDQHRFSTAAPRHNSSSASEASEESVSSIHGQRFAGGSSSESACENSSAWHHQDEAHRRTQRVPPVNTRAPRESGAHHRHKNHSPNKPQSRDEVVSSNDLVHALNRLDHRSVPKPDVFDSTSGQPFELFLQTFEEYCSNNFRGSTLLWVSELGRFLSGDMLSAYSSLRVPGESYSTLIGKLCKWRRDSKEAYQTNLRHRFTKAKMLPNEGYRLYAARLEKSYRIAYPRRTIEYSRTLRQKFFDTVPRAFRKQLKTAHSICITMNGGAMPWSNILALASRQDADKDETDTSPQVSDSDAIWVNTCTPREPTKTYYADGKKKASLPANGIPSVLPTAPFLPSRQICDFCKKPGHMRHECRKRLGLCLVCGSSEHTIARCPHRRERSALQRMQNRESFTPSPRRVRIQEDTNQIEERTALN